MYIKFKLKNGTGSRGAYGLQGISNWAMTASANSTATISDFSATFGSDLQDLIIISNAEAGGWQIFDTVNAISTWSNWSAGWEASTFKTGKNFKKRFQLAYQGIDSNYGSWAPKCGLYDADRNSYIQGLTTLAYYTGSSSTAYSNTFYSNGLPDALIDGFWNLSVTSKYVYFWPDSGPFTGTGRRFLAGVADLEGTPQYLLNASSDNFPAVGFYTSSNDQSAGIGSTSSFWNDYIQCYFAGIDGNGALSTYSSTAAPITQSTASTSISHAVIPWTYHPPHYPGIVDSTYEQYPPVFDEWGSTIGSLTPLTVMSPLRGVPPQNISGIYYYSPQKVVNTTDGAEWSTKGAQAYNSRIIYDDIGDKYVIMHQYGSNHLKAIRAM